MQQKEQQEFVRDEHVLGLGYFLANTGYWLVAPVTRSGMGRRAGGMPWLVAFVILLFYARQQQSEALEFYTWAWLGMSLFRRLTPGKEVVTLYQGWPWLTGWLLRNELTARLAEVPLVFLAGAAVADADAATGKLLMWASLGLAVKYWIEATYLRRIDEATDDQILIMQSRMSRRGRG
jgi:hypothetical protein